MATQIADDLAAGNPVKAAILLIVGEPFSDNDKQLILEEIVKGFKGWNCDATDVDINDELVQIANNADLGEEGPQGERIIHHRSDNTAVEILINPQSQTLKDSLRAVLIQPSPVKSVIYAGYAFQGMAAWVLQDDLFTVNHFIQVFKDSNVENAVKQVEGASLMLYSLCGSEWTSALKGSDVDRLLKWSVNPKAKLESCSGLNQFSAYIGNLVHAVPVGSLLQASDVIGNISFSRPVLYIFPGYQGDAALFGMKGFNMLVNGGYSRRPCFWDFVRHLDGIDALLLTHLGPDNLFGIKSLLERKVFDSIHPDIDYMFMNPGRMNGSKAVASREGSPSELLINLAAEGSMLLEASRKLGHAAHSLTRSLSGNLEPINLFHKVGKGSLDMYVLNPVGDAKEMKEFLTQWGKQSPHFNQANGIPIPNCVSLSVLLVVRPASSTEKVTRILFPGTAPQYKLLEGLERVKHLEFLKHPTFCTHDAVKAKKLAAASNGRASSTTRRPVSAPVPRTVATTKAEPPKRLDTKSSTSRVSATALSAKPSKIQKDSSNKRASSGKGKEKVKIDEKEKEDKSKSSASSSPSKVSVKTISPTKTPSPLAQTPATASPDEPPAISTSPVNQNQAPASEPVSHEQLPPSPLPNSQLDGDVMTKDSADMVSQAPVKTESLPASDNRFASSPEALPEPDHFHDDVGVGHHQTADTYITEKGKLQELGIYDDNDEGIDNGFDKENGMFGARQEADDEEVQPQALPDPVPAIETPSSSEPEFVQDSFAKPSLMEQSQIFEDGIEPDYGAELKDMPVAEHGKKEDPLVDSKAEDVSLNAESKTEENSVIAEPANEDHHHIPEQDEPASYAATSEQTDLLQSKMEEELSSADIIEADTLDISRMQEGKSSVPNDYIEDQNPENYEQESNLAISDDKQESGVMPAACDDQQGPNEVCEEQDLSDREHAQYHQTEADQALDPYYDNALEGSSPALEEPSFTDDLKEAQLAVEEPSISDSFKDISPAVEEQSFNTGQGEISPYDEEPGFDDVKESSPTHEGYDDHDHNMTASPVRDEPNFAESLRDAHPDFEEPNFNGDTPTALEHQKDLDNKRESSPATEEAILEADLENDVKEACPDVQEAGHDDTAEEPSLAVDETRFDRDMKESSPATEEMEIGDLKDASPSVEEPYFNDQGKEDTEAGFDDRTKETSPDLEEPGFDDSVQEIRAAVEKPSVGDGAKDTDPAVEKPGFCHDEHEASPASGEEPDFESNSAIEKPVYDDNEQDVGQAREQLDFEVSDKECGQAEEEPGSDDYEREISPPTEPTDFVGSQREASPDLKESELDNNPKQTDPSLQEQDIDDIQTETIPDHDDGMKAESALNDQKIDQSEEQFSALGDKDFDKGLENDTQHPEESMDRDDKGLEHDTQHPEEPMDRDSLLEAKPAFEEPNLDDSCEESSPAYEEPNVIDDNEVSQNVQAGGDNVTEKGAFEMEDADEEEDMSKMKELEMQDKLPQESDMMRSTIEGMEESDDEGQEEDEETAEAVDYGDSENDDYVYEKEVNLEDEEVLVAGESTTTAAAVEDQPMDKEMAQHPQAEVKSQVFEADQNQETSDIPESFQREDSPVPDDKQMNDEIPVDKTDSHKVEEECGQEDSDLNDAALADDDKDVDEISTVQQQQELQDQEKDIENMAEQQDVGARDKQNFSPLEGVQDPGHVQADTDSVPNNRQASPFKDDEANHMDQEVGPADFDPLTQWGPPTGLPAPAPLFDKAGAIPDDVDHGEETVSEKDSLDAVEDFNDTESSSKIDHLEFDPLAEWGHPMGLPSPPPPEVTSKTGNTKKNATDAKKTDSKKSASASKTKPEKRSNLTTKSPTKPMNGTPDTPKSSRSKPEIKKTVQETPPRSTRPASGKSLDTSKDDSKSRTPSSATRRGTAKTRASPDVIKMPPLPPFTPFYMDLAYIPNHGDLNYVDSEFFKRVRARYYVLSARNPNPKVLEFLIDAKGSWDKTGEQEVTVIPTYETQLLHHWMAVHKEKLAENKIDIAPAASRCTVRLQDHEDSCYTYRLEF